MLYYFWKTDFMATFKIIHGRITMIMRNKVVFFVIATAAAFLSSCTTKLSLNIKEKIENSTVKLEDVQFYNSERIKLQRVLPKTEKVAEAAGKIKFRKGEFIETLILRRNTPGVYVSQDEDRIFAAFEKGGNLALPFRLNGGYYVLDNRYADDKYLVTYDGKDYELLKGHKAFVMLKKKSRFVTDKKRRYLRGVEVK